MNISFDKKTSRWRASQQYKGQRKHFYSVEKTKTKARAEINAKIEEWHKNLNLRNPNVRLSEAWELFLADYSRKNKTTSTNRINSTYKAHVYKLEHKKLTDISKLDWQYVIDDAYKNGAHSVKTLKSIASTIRTFCKWAATKALINDLDVPLYLDISEGKKPQEKRILQPHELRTLFSEAAETDFYIHCFRFFVLTGLRRGELCALQFERDFDGKYITIRESISNEGIVTDGKTVQANRSIRLSELAMEQIVKHRGLQQGFYLFPSSRGFRISPKVLYRHWKSWSAEHGINLTIHELRHSHISYSRLKTSISIDELKNLYGHSSSMDTDGVYVHDIDLSPDEKRAKEENEKEKARTLDKMFKSIISE